MKLAKITWWSTPMILALGIGCATRPMENPPPLERAHAHNDYLHLRPLEDALHHGFCSVEADIHLVGGQLLVAHDRDDVSAERTLESLYLRPLQGRAARFGGRIYPDGPSLTLLIDIKTEAESTYRALQESLEPFKDMLTVFQSGKPVVTKAVTVIVSGNRPRALMAGQATRYAAMDGRLADLESNPPLDLMPLISDNWQNHFTWRGQGHPPESERTALRAWVRQAHAQGRRLRFWATPDQAEAWKVLREEGVDLINTDDLEGLSRFLTTD